MTDDAQLLRSYAEEKSQEAFAELVRRHLDLVYAVAVRKVGGDVHLAQDVVQRVFADLATKAPTLARHPVLTGWLFTSTHYAATQLVRSERRRRLREEKVHAMNEMFHEETPATDWERLRPMLDDLVNELDVRDREALLARFFESRPLASVGARLRLTEDGARSRVDRALGKLNAALARRGVTSTAAALAVALGSQTGIAAPAGMAAAVTGAALGGTGAAAMGWTAFFMSIGKLQIAMVVALAATGGAVCAFQVKANAGLSSELAAAREQQREVAALRTENRRLASAAAEVAALRADDAEFVQLSRRATEAQVAQGEARKRAVARTAEQTYQAEIDRMNREGNALVEEYKALMSQAGDPAVSADGQADARNAAQQKLLAIQAKKREVDAYRASIGHPAAKPDTANINGGTLSVGGGTLTMGGLGPAQPQPGATLEFRRKPPAPNGPANPVPGDVQPPPPH